MTATPETPSTSSNIVVTLAASLSAFAVFVIAALVVLCLRRKRVAGEDSGNTGEEDDNPVYGIYYFADGEDKVDNGEIEMVDANELYG